MSKALTEERAPVDQERKEWLLQCIWTESTCIWVRPSPQIKYQPASGISDTLVLPECMYRRVR